MANAIDHRGPELVHEMISRSLSIRSAASQEPGDTPDLPLNRDSMRLLSLHLPLDMIRDPRYRGFYTRETLAACGTLRLSHGDTMDEAIFPADLGIVLGDGLLDSARPHRDDTDR
jgi:hypothetical protein